MEKTHMKSSDSLPRYMLLKYHLNPRKLQIFWYPYFKPEFFVSNPVLMLSMPEVNLSNPSNPSINNISRMLAMSCEASTCAAWAQGGPLALWLSTRHTSR